LFYAGTRGFLHQQPEETGTIVLLTHLISHLIQKIEGDNNDITFVRVDSDHIDPRKER
jgi:molecular chaperone HtpG